MHSVSEGHASTNVVPANRSIIIADSRFRAEDVTDTPYDFKCDLGGTAIYAKEIYYQKLYWNQPLFSHNNSNCEIRFQMNNDESKTYVVYVTPFVIFKEFDGNPEGQYLANPAAQSYANNVTVAFQNDVRLLQTNQSLVNPTLPFPGSVYDSFGNRVVIYMRYSAAKGFCVSMEQDSPIPGNYYSIRFLPCSWIAKAHFVHGFGIYDPKVSTSEMVPHSFFSTSIWSDTAPSLLPTRYIVVQSPELNKDRRLISFHNGNSANFINELAIFSLNRLRSGAFHEVGVGDDATVVSLRKEYTPQSFRIQILDENGNEIRCSDPITKLLSSQGINPSVFISFLPPHTGRGNPTFMNYLIFGYGPMHNGVPKGPIYSFPNIEVAPAGMKGLSLPFQWLDFLNLSVPQNIDITLSLPLLVGPPPNFSVVNPGPYPTDVGFAQSIAMTTFTPHWWDAAPFQPYTFFTWYRDLNPKPFLLWEYYFGAHTPPGPPIPQIYGGYVYVIMFDANTYQVIQTLKGKLQVTPLNFANPLNNEGNLGSNNWEINPDYIFPPSPSTMIVGFSLAWIGLQNGFVGSWDLMYAPHAGYEWKFTLSNTDDQSNIQTEYIPPNISGDYTFGDPLANALCEEVIHEIAAVLEYS
jgi:hypothetical protein